MLVNNSQSIIPTDNNPVSMIHSNLELRIEQDQLIEEEKNLDIIMERFFEEMKRDD